MPLTKPQRPRPADGLPETIPLRLMASNGGLGIELYEPQHLGPVVVDSMIWTLPGLSFPVDLSGGVRSFRSRRGELQRLELSFDLVALSKWFSGRVRSALGGQPEPLEIWLEEGGFGVGFSEHQGAVAFNLLLCPEEDRAQFVVSEPRSAGYAGPALPQARRVIEAALGRELEGRGRVLDLGPIAARVVRSLLPALGVRAPSVAGVRVSEIWAEGERLRVILERDSAPWAATEEAGRALSLARLLRDADETLLSGHWDEARTHYMSALEKAPRHPELCKTVAEIDAEYAERSEAALGLLVESLPATSFGRVGATLLARVGDLAGAELAITKAVSQERYAALASRLWLERAQWEESAPERAEALDRALAASPASSLARWSRFELRLNTGDLNGAVADAEHLEAAARGSLARHQVVVKAARKILDVGHTQVAGKLFQRALRYAPRDPEATLGLGIALVQTGAPERALTLLERAATHGEGRVLGEAQLALGRLLATHFHDLPQAISKVRQVQGRGPVAISARHLEANWRAKLGDLSGAQLAYGRLRESIELSHDVPPELAAKALVEAASFSETQMAELAAAERYLGLALTLSPRDAQIKTEYRRVAGQRALAGRSRSGMELEDASATKPEPARGQLPDVEPPVQSDAEHELDGFVVEQAAPDSEAPDSAQLELEAQQLTARFMVTPSDAAVVAQLASALEKLGRLEELYALLFAQYEDAEPELQTRLTPMLKQVLKRLIESAAPDQAELYEQALQRLS